MHATNGGARPNCKTTQSRYNELIGTHSACSSNSICCHGDSARFLQVESRRPVSWTGKLRLVLIWIARHWKETRLGISFLQFSKSVNNSHLLTLKALPRQWVALETANFQHLRSRMLTSVSPFFLMYLLMVSMYLNFGLPLGLTHSTTMFSTVLVVPYGFHLYVWHVHTSVVASASGVLLSAKLLLLPWSLHFFCALSG